MKRQGMTEGIAFRRKGMTKGITFRRKGMSRAVEVLIALVIILGVGMIVFIVSSTSLTKFFVHVNESSSEENEVIKCQTLCYQCCMSSPSECGTALWSEDNNGCICKC